ncbi:hypothetical protein [Actinomadura rugatobispora]|uniref:Uncharacterized protein n=1 Tax=Actinomadura rugatobispora TaxID=1994 RepID=A0ABW1A906_9ACTN|nr:hypothetical protein GCM10010200_039780 [Actinomadura rugatobispora]
MNEQPAPEATDPKSTRPKGHAHGTDKGDKGGGVPPDQQPPHPS